MNNERLNGLLNALEHEFAPLECSPLIALPDSKSCYEDIQLEFENFNALNWDNATSRDLLEYSEPYITLPPEIFYFLLPKFFRIILRESGESELVGTFFEMLLRRLGEPYGEEESKYSLTPRQIRLIYTTAYELEWVEYQKPLEYGSAAFLDRWLAHEVEE